MTNRPSGQSGFACIKAFEIFNDSCCVLQMSLKSVSGRRITRPAACSRQKCKARADCDVKGKVAILSPLLGRKSDGSMIGPPCVAK